MGPVLGPVIGGYIGAKTDDSWRWTEWTDMSLAAVVLLFVVTTQRETFAPRFLQWKAKHLRAITADERYQSEAGLARVPSLLRWKAVLALPFRVTAKEPILILLTLWLTLIWVIMFTFLSGYEHLFGGNHNTTEGETGLCFIGIAIGLLLSSSTVPLVALRIRHDLHQARRGSAEGDLAPESRLWYALISAPAVPIALFWMAWTDSESVSIWSPLAASVLLGYGMLGVFTGSCEYIVHTYGRFGPAALNFNTFTRYIVAGVMMELAPPMWRDLGVQWPLVAMGCVSVLLVPVPYVLFRWGPWVRARSAYAVR